MRITMVWATCTKWLKDANSFGFFCAMPVAAIPTNTEKKTTAMVEVLRAPVMSRNGLSGINDSSILGSEMSCAVDSEPCRYSPRATSAAEAVRPTAVRPNNFAIRMPIMAATAVVAIRIPIVSALILPSEAASRNLRMAPMIETMISGITIICSSFTYPLPSTSSQALVALTAGEPAP